MQRQRVVIAGSAAAAISALGYRAWDRGVFAGATGPAYTPWDEWRGSDQDGHRRPLRGAILAASPHNTQPWLFEVSGDAVAVYADRARHLGSFDPFRREMHLGLGCAIENFVCAACLRARYRCAAGGWTARDISWPQARSRRPDCGRSESAVTRSVLRCDSQTTHEPRSLSR